MENSELTHLDSSGSARMVDVSTKDITTREATAQSKVFLKKETLELITHGNIPKGDVLEIEANVSTMEQNLLIAENNYTLSKISLAQLLLLPIQNFEIKETIYLKEDVTILNTDPKTIYEFALTNRNEIKLAKTNLKIANKDLAISKSSLLPTLSGFYSYNSRVLFDTQTSFSNQLDLNARYINIEYNSKLVENFCPKQSVGCYTSADRGRIIIRDDISKPHHDVVIFGLYSDYIQHSNSGLIDSSLTCDLKVSYLKEVYKHNLANLYSGQCDAIYKNKVLVMN